jgi:NADPH-dependent 2,4-dienoyl-CoA reductase/sulfur reductase-like enzyme/peroxiredoxin family protein/TusA-related sulfurtransferase/rhodanese-related sulfurtransferase
MAKKVLIVGGVAGGASCAARLRRLDENAEIIMFERGPHISFANCGLPYYIGGTIKERDSLLVQTPEAMRDRFKIDVRVENEVLSINRDNKSVRVKNIKENLEYTESYDVLVLSPGSAPLRPAIEGIEEVDNILSIWNVVDTDKIKNYIENHKVKTATVIGGGFIGLEMVENLKELDINVNLVEMANQVMAPIDFEMAQLVHEHLKLQGVNLYLNNGTAKFVKKGEQTTVVLKDNTELDSDLVILSIGIKPNSKLAKDAGLQLNQKGGIVVTNNLLTSDSAIYAIGDVIEVEEFITKTKTMVPLAGPANKQGRICADNICGKTTTYKGSQGTSVAKVFDLTVSSTGLNEKTLKRLGKKYGEDYKIAYANLGSHAGYYPGSFPMTIKLIFDVNGKVLGAQNVGLDGVEKRIDVIATAIRFNATVNDLTNLELSYAPPYSSAKDPVNMVAYIAENILNNNETPILVNEIKDLDLNKNLILDVRDQDEIELGMIDNAINIPLNNLRNNLNKLDKEKTIIVHCAVGLRAHVASRILLQNGFKVNNLLGGYKLYDSYIKNFNNLKKENIFTENIIKEEVTNMDINKSILLDACGLQCPGPIMKLNKTIDSLEDGQILKVMVTDPGFVVDAQAWCKKTGNTFIKHDKEDKAYVVYIQKSKKELSNEIYQKNNGTTIVVFSGDLDKAIASLIIANGAVAMGKEVSMFFTFWGLNVLRKSEKQNIKKGFMEKMFSSMMPRGVEKLTISKMNFGGAGTKMMRYIMKKKNVLTLQQLLDEALDNGVKMIACTMSMDIMGITEEELIDRIDLGGVAAYLGDTESSNHNLFI